MISRAFTHVLTVCLVMSGLSACGSDKSQISTTTALKAVATTMTSALRKKPEAASSGIGLTRAELANIVTPVDLVTIERRGAQGVIAKTGSNRGVETWSSLDHKTLSLQEGVIVATRGLGDDLMSAAVPRAGQLRSASQNHQRVHVVLNGEDEPVSLRFNCSVSNQGAESIIVVEQTYATQHMRENCSGTSGGFTNDFWFQPGGKLRKSRQWISDSVGYVVIEHLL
jgi:hypothetical protein